VTAQDTQPEVVVVGVDGSEAGERAAHFAGRIAREAGTTLLVVHIVPWSPFAVQTAEDNEQRHVTKQRETQEAHEGIVDPLVAALGDAGVKAEGMVRHGHPAETLCDIGHERGATHLLVGRRGQSRVRTLLFGSTPGNLIQIATVPVTVVP
jgi:nucleotide-binding universal stress UspA family protein